MTVKLPLEVVQAHNTSDETIVTTGEGAAISMFQSNRRAIVLSVSHDAFGEDGECRGSERDFKDRLYTEVQRAMTSEAGRL